MGNTNKPVAKKRGRPPLAKGQVKAKIVPMRLHDADVKLFEKAAKQTKQTLSEWMRSTLREAANGSV
ncbi:MAG TPA: hypothetical protein VJU84_02750 [Pyrinomonadaceae bacterium]|nr:hypothetical protein [Pyrinomonadaceae bacterium]